MIDAMPLILPPMPLIRDISFYTPLRDATLAADAAMPMLRHYTIFH